MKNTLLITALLFATITTVSAQDEDPLTQGRYIAGGGLNISLAARNTEPIQDDFFSSGESDITTFSIRPYFGKFIKDRLVVGGSLLFSFQNNDFSDTNGSFVFGSGQNSTTTGVGVFVKKYYPIAGVFGAFVQPEINFNILNSESENTTFDQDTQLFTNNSTSDSDGWQLSMGVNAGLYVLLGQRFSIESNFGRLSFNHTDIDVKRTSTSATLPTTEEMNRKITGVNLNLMNRLSLDRLLVLNFLF